MMADRLPHAFTWALLGLLAWSLAGTALLKADSGEDTLPTIAAKTAKMEKQDGLLTTYLDRNSGKVWLLLPAPQSNGELVRLLYYEGLRRGLGSNPIGLDRGQLGDGRLLVLRRYGPKVLFEQPNLKFRAGTDRASERRATEESFASSILWGHEIGALDPDGAALLDLTGFLVRDAHEVVSTLADTGQGDFALDASRSAVDLANCLSFPNNLEFEAILTFTGSNPGTHVKRTVPLPESVTLIQHQSLVRLPDDGYRPRKLDKRTGSFGIDYQDYATSLDDSIKKEWIIRHRLEKVDPTKARSKVKKPLVYYVDPGAPEPVRSALIEGASWWAEAFEKAGFIDAFRVEVLPEGAHPMDVRYNVIQWVHRSTRGWSYGGGIFDPRTGEMLKGNVSLGSLRVRQDRLLFEGLLGTEKTGSGAADDPIQVSLARIRQLSAHEVGHALGLNHNFAASAYNRGSVMDYPAPFITLDENGEFDVSQAYSVGIGVWDIQAIRYAYSEFPPGADEEAELEAILKENVERGLTYLADEDTRPGFASDPRANVWDNGEDAVGGLQLALEVRRRALDRFGAKNLPLGRPMAELEPVLAPVYFHHRYALNAAVKKIGGFEYNYTVRGDGQWVSRRVDGDRQREALETLLSLLDPAELDLPESILELLVPMPNENVRDRELFVASATRPAFDALGAAETAVGGVVSALLEPHRMARLIDFHRRDTSLPSLEEVLDALLAKAFEKTQRTPRHQELQSVIQRVVVDHLIGLARLENLPPRTRARLEQSLKDVVERLGDAEGAPAALLKADIQRFLDRHDTGETQIWHPAPLPPGSPIGSGTAGHSTGGGAAFYSLEPGCSHDS